MTIAALPARKDNYIWAIVNEAKHTLTCIDPGESAPVIRYAHTNQLILTNILVTHHHADHTDGIAELLQSFPEAKVYGPADERIPLVNYVVRGEDIIHIDHYAFRVLNTPGHTSTHVCYQEPMKSWLFCGDTLFSAGCGRVFDGTFAQLHHSLLLLQQLPDDTQLFCGHEYTRQNLRFAASIEPANETIKNYAAYLQERSELCSLPSSIALEKKINPFFRIETPNLKQFAEKEGIDPSNPLAIFSHLRRKKDSFI
ncbi:MULTISPECIES: hydroxyacylglutathione hydrolase [Legionella]|uniref:Hydroxyacylglutathione hydrolase n=1 Tax=Legionella septentrionalis TaxID=2498109 RepID=A0A3S0XFB9_9GAMM|nr:MULTISPECIES: hydroxyacylglutathione hydrolase [Legionella]MCP0913633.1 hydroxyacylglutathione hydrolase [Legionella sp. 27cVA30]RUQ81640.1 hydroxyacylglutathione hydrolase [Legionella septentrionalis]RUQ96339.1 hydroxyacylglutathione hydrolase [Legionella septentrionalis]RUR09088.1 hydroxyacylglutathione hydrolase [Legionella septentrionalis]